MSHIPQSQNLLKVQKGCDVSAAFWAKRRSVNVCVPSLMGSVTPQIVGFMDSLKRVLNIISDLMKYITCCYMYSQI